MKPQDPGDLLDHIGGLRSRCDLDLLLFFARHPNSLLPSESLAAFLGYDLPQIAESLNVLLSAGLLQRKQTPAHAARLYVFADGGPNVGWLPALLDLASTREGRLALRFALLRRSAGGASNAEARALVVPLNSNAGPGTKAG